MTTTYVQVVDYGVGNLGSLRNALTACGATAVLLTEPKLTDTEHPVILPGVGSFGYAMDQLTSRGWIEPLNHARQSGTRILGVCLGLQLMLRGSEEAPGCAGLGWVEAEATWLPPRERGIRSPHMGWNSVRAERASALVDPSALPGDYYFVHSYAAPIGEWTVGSTHHGERFSSIIESGNVIACQFHPEKSGKNGLQLLRSFLESASC